MPTTITIGQPSIQGPTMHQQPSPPPTPSPSTASPPRQQFFSRSTHKKNRSVSSFSSRHSDDDDEDSPYNRPTLHQILLNQGRGQYTLDNFGAFLQSQFCYENLAFWIASRQYKLCAQSLYLSVHQSVPQFDLTASSAQFLNGSQAKAFKDLQLKMRAILEAFVLPSSPHELNLSDAIRCRLLRSVAEGDYHSQVLEQARDAVMDLMKCSSYPVFVEGIVSKRASSTAGSAQSLTSSSSSLSSSTNSSSTAAAAVAGADGSWRHKAKHHLKLVSKMLKRTS